MVENVLPVVDIPIRGGAAAQAKMAGVVNEMCKSDAGRAILEFAADYGYELKFDRKTAKEGLFGYADPCEEVCVLNPKATMAQNIVTLAHELRHAYQYTMDEVDEPDHSGYTAKTMMHRSRVMEADAESYGCLVAWELKQKGMKACWNDFSASYPEIAAPFETALNETGDVNQARTAAFKGWYDNADRRDYYDQSMASCVETTNPSVFRKKLKSVTAAKFVNAVCRDPDGNNYFTADPKELEKGKFATMYADVKDRIAAHMAKRDALPDRTPDKSLAAIKTQPRPRPETLPARAVSPAAKECAVTARQESAARKIRAAKSRTSAAVWTQRGNAR